MRCFMFFFIVIAMISEIMPIKTQSYITEYCVFDSLYMVDGLKISKIVDTSIVAIDTVIFIYGPMNGIKYDLLNNELILFYYSAARHQHPNTIEYVLDKRRIFDDKIEKHMVGDSSTISIKNYGQYKFTPFFQKDTVLLLSDSLCLIVDMNKKEYYEKRFYSK